jgi:hypothetical protein
MLVLLPQRFGCVLLLLLLLLVRLSLRRALLLLLLIWLQGLQTHLCWPSWLLQLLLLVEVLLLLYRLGSLQCTLLL